MMPKSLPRVFKIFLWLMVLFILGSVEKSWGDQKYPAGSPTRAIQDLDDLLDDYIVSASTPEEKTFNQKLKKRALEGTFDIRRLAELALAKHWVTLSAKQQDHFVGVLKQLLERKAVFAKEQGGKKEPGKKKEGASYRVTYSGHDFLDATKLRALVKTWVHIPSENLKIALNYKLHRIAGKQIQPKDPLRGKTLPVPATAGQEWKVFDVIVDGASLLDNYKYQFDNIIRKNGYEDLIRRMEARLAEMKQKEVEEGIVVD